MLDLQKTNCTVILPQIPCPRYSFDKLIKKGYPSSPIIFTAAADMLFVLIKD